MIYEFKCRATGNLVMTEPVGRMVLEIIGKTPGPQGIVTPEQMPDAIAALRAAVDRERKQGVRPAGATGDDDDDDPANAVSFAQRAYPFVEMLEAALKARRDVTWGV